MKTNCGLFSWNNALKNHSLKDLEYVSLTSCWLNARMCISTIRHHRERQNISKQILMLEVRQSTKNKRAEKNGWRPTAGRNIRLKNSRTVDMKADWTINSPMRQTFGHSSPTSNNKDKTVYEVLRNTKTRNGETQMTIKCPSEDDQDKFSPSAGARAPWREVQYLSTSWGLLINCIIMSTPNQDVHVRYFCISYKLLNVCAL